MVGDPSEARVVDSVAVAFFNSGGADYNLPLDNSSAVQRGGNARYVGGHLGMQWSSQRVKRKKNNISEACVH